MTILLTLAAGIAAITTPTQTVRVDAAPSVRIHYGDLNLATADGAHRLQARIDGAAQQLCGTVDGRDLKMLQLTGECTAAARDSARPQFEAAMAAARTMASGTTAATSAVLVISAK